MRLTRSIVCKTSLTPANFKNFSYELYGVGVVQNALFYSQGFVKYEMFPFSKVFENESANFYNYETPKNGFNLYHSSLMNEKGLRVEDLHCFNDLIELLDESRLVENLKFKIEYINKLLNGSVIAKIFFD